MSARLPPLDLGRHRKLADGRQRCAISHTTAIADVWSAFVHDFDALNAKRAFAYQYYGRGMGEDFLETLCHPLIKLQGSGVFRTQQ